jgi:hypothetical protein
MGRRAKGAAVLKRWRMGKPEPTERPAEAVQRKFRLPLTPVGSLSPMHEQP